MVFWSVDEGAGAVGAADEGGSVDLEVPGIDGAGAGEAVDVGAGPAGEEGCNGAGLGSDGAGDGDDVGPGDAGGLGEEGGVGEDGGLGDDGGAGECTGPGECPGPGEWTGPGERTGVGEWTGAGEPTGAGELLSFGAGDGWLTCDGPPEDWPAPPGAAMS